MELNLCRPKRRLKTTPVMSRHIGSLSSSHDRRKVITCNESTHRDRPSSPAPLSIVSEPPQPYPTCFSYFSAYSKSLPPKPNVGNACPAHGTSSGVECPQGILRAHEGLYLPRAQAGNHGLIADQRTPLLRLRRGSREDLEPGHALPPAGTQFYSISML